MLKYVIKDNHGNYAAGGIQKKAKKGEQIIYMAFTGLNRFFEYFDKEKQAIENCQKLQSKYGVLGLNFTVEQMDINMADTDEVAEKVIVTKDYTYTVKTNEFFAIRDDEGYYYDEYSVMEGCTNDRNIKFRRGFGIKEKAQEIIDYINKTWAVNLHVETIEL